MNFLDIRTILIGFVLSDIVCALVIVSLWLHDRGKFAGISLWVANFTLQTVSILLVALRGYVPDFLSMVVGNGLNILGAILLLVGLEHFLGVKGRHWHNWVMLAAFAAVETWFALPKPVLAARNLNISLALLFVSAQCSWLLLRKAEPGFRKNGRHAGIIFGIYGFVSVIRVFQILLAPSGNDFLKSGFFDAAMLLLYQMLSIALTFSLFVMVNRRLSETLDQDISLRARMEEELRISEANLKEAQAMGRIGHWSIDAGTRGFLWSEEVYAIHGIPPGTAVSHDTYRQFIHAEDRQRVLAAMRAAMAGLQEEFGIDYSILRPDGTMRTVALKGKTVTDRAGVLAGIRGTMQDITERRELQRENAYLASFPTMNSNPVIEIGTDGKVRYANAASTATLVRLGMEPDLRLFLPGTPEELSALWSLCSASPLTREVRLGEATFHLNLNASGKDTLRIYAVDITDRARLEVAIKELNADLEMRVQQRTSELRAANAELEAFSYSVSHDLRSPLRGIDGFIHAFLEDYGSLVPDEGRRYLDRTRNAAQHMGQLIEALLQLSHLTRSPLQMQETDLSALALEICQELTPEAPERDVRWSIEPGMKAVADPEMMRVVLVNLMKNAWKFTSRREHAHIAVGTLLDPEHGPAFFVQDDGAGFDPRYRTKLFNAFQRLHAQQEYPGTGIGLATVQRAVQRHGGDVWATGEIDRGAIFFFTIPIPCATAPTSEEHA